MYPRFAWHAVRWLLSAAAAGLLYDAFKSSVIPSGIERLLPDLGFLVKPLMIVVGITLGGTAVTILGTDLWRWYKNRNAVRKAEILKQHQMRLKREEQAKLAAKQKVDAEKERKRQFILERLDYLVEWHEDHRYASTFSRSRTIDDQGKAVEYAYDLARLKLVRPDLFDTVTTWGSDMAVTYLAIVRRKFKMRGLEAAMELVERWERSDNPKAKMDTRKPAGS